MGPTKAPTPSYIVEMAYGIVTGIDLSSIFKKRNWNSSPAGIAVLKISPPESRCICLETVTSPKLNSISDIFWKRYRNL